jgi:aspartate racemase
MPKHIGIVAISAEGAALCYRTICVEGAATFSAHNHPEVTMHTIPLARYMDRLNADDWAGSAELILRSARKLADAGADFLICPDNTAHQSIDLIVNRSPLPWLHIASEVASVAKARGYHRVGVLGTKFLMEGPVYPPKLSAAGLAHEIPAAEDRERINRIIFDELVYGRFEEPARRFFQDVIAKLQDRGCDAVALSCTEIPLLISETDSCLPTLDSTRLLARAALREASKI